jgi:hypothetical protein
MGRTVGGGVNGPLVKQQLLDRGYGNIDRVIVCYGHNGCTGMVLRLCLVKSNRTLDSYL